MPIYPVSLTVPADTPSDRYARVDVDIRKAIITRYDVHFPAGCHGMVHITIWHGIKQIVPHEEGATLWGDDETVPIPEYWECPSDPTRLTIRGWSPGTHYDHTITVRIITMPPEKAYPGAILVDLWRRFLRRVGVL